MPTAEPLKPPNQLVVTHLSVDGAPNPQHPDRPQAHHRVSHVNNPKNLSGLLCPILVNIVTGPTSPVPADTRTGLCGWPSTATIPPTVVSTVAPWETPVPATLSGGTRIQDNHTVSDATVADTCILRIQSFKCKGFKQSFSYIFWLIQDCLLLYICLQAYTYKAHGDIMKTHKGGKW